MKWRCVQTGYHVSEDGMTIIKREVHGWFVQRVDDVEWKRDAPIPLVMAVSATEIGGPFDSLKEAKATQDVHVLQAA